MKTKLLTFLSCAILLSGCYRNVVVSEREVLIERAEYFKTYIPTEATIIEIVKFDNEPAGKIAIYEFRGKKYMVTIGWDLNFNICPYQE